MYSLIHALLRDKIKSWEYVRLKLKLMVQRNSEIRENVNQKTVKMIPGT